MNAHNYFIHIFFDVLVLHHTTKTNSWKVKAPLKNPQQLAFFPENALGSSGRCEGVNMALVTCVALAVQKLGRPSRVGWAEAWRSSGLGGFGMVWYGLVCKVVPWVDLSCFWLIGLDVGVVIVVVVVVVFVFTSGYRLLELFSSYFIEVLFSECF